jgi:hypothetical protein
VPAGFDYAVVRVVPRVEREEFINVGAVVFCGEHDFLAAKLELDETRLRCLFPAVDVDVIREHLDAFQLVCVGGPTAGPIGLLPTRERWHWLVAPKSTIIQTSAPHTGLCDDPAAAIERVMNANVRPLPPGSDETPDP